MNKQLKLGAVLSYVSIAINILAGLVFTPWMIDQIGQSDYGMYTLANSLITLFLIDFGLSSATSRYLSKYLAEGRQDLANGFLGMVYKLYLIVDGVILLGFVLGLPANEIVLPIILMTYLSQGTLVEMGELTALKTLLVQNGWTWLTGANMILFSLFHWPCSTTLMTIRKETGSWKWTAAAFLLPTAVGMTLCMIIAGIFG